MLIQAVTLVPPAIKAGRDTSLPVRNLSEPVVNLDS